MLKEKLEKLEKANKVAGEDVEMEADGEEESEAATTEQTAALLKRLSQLIAGEKSEKAMPEDLKDENRLKQLQEGIRDCRSSIAKLQPPAKRRAELEEELRKQ